MVKIDMEYATQYIPEKQFLWDHGVKPTFIKVINEVTTYKYKKTPELFKALMVFYSNNIGGNNNEYRKQERVGISDGSVLGEKVDSICSC